MKNTQYKNLLKGILAGRVNVTQATAELTRPAGNGHPIRFAEFTKANGLISGEGFTDLTEEQMPEVVAKMQEDLEAAYPKSKPVLWVEIKTYGHD